MTNAGRAFLKKASQDEVLGRKIAALCGETNQSKVIRQILVIAREEGFSLAEKDFLMTEEMDDAEMAAIAGGMRSKCECHIAGFGMGDGGDVCPCVIVGMGK